MLVAGRMIQAAGAAAIVPTSLGLLLPVFPRRQHNLVVGAWAGVAAVAASSGAPLGGLLVAVDWRWIFIVNVPLGLFTVLLGRRVLPEVRANAGARLPDPVSMLSLLAAVTLLILGTVQGQALQCAAVGPGDCARPADGGGVRGQQRPDRGRFGRAAPAIAGASVTAAAALFWLAGRWSWRPRPARPG